MREQDKLYFEARAEAELALAQAASHPAVVRAHYLLAGFYLDRVYGQDNQTSSAAEEIFGASRAASRANSDAKPGAAADMNEPAGRAAGRRQQHWPFMEPS